MVKIKKFVSTGDFTLGKPLANLKKFAKLIRTNYAVGVNSGTDAIKLSLRALGIKQGDEIIAANTFVATVGAITELGAKPIYRLWWYFLYECKFNRKNK